MTPFTVQVLRRVAVLAGLAALALAVTPWALRWAGLLGPSPEQDVAAASRSLQAARSFGASRDDPALEAAEGELARARELLAAGRRRAARMAAHRAEELAIQAQRVALAGREAARRRAEAVVSDVDRQLNRLEDLYDRGARGLPRSRQAPLLSRMKAARQAGGGIFLAFDQGQYARVLEQADPCRRLLAEVGRELEGAAARPGP